ncbi:MAG: UDP-N-acetylmuramoyl-L-alanine--D-glutamate ligase [Candidatus Paracaedibacteraceae bacterium]|nr:UDP-N-acetylmuramoyl-L-alanine--D-glutamate ligase [Candidatus Paracaedibacteraceae bacterium]
MKTYLVHGLARSGMACVEFLLKSGCLVYVLDSDLAKMGQASQKGAHIWENQDMSMLTAVIQSPGIPLTHPLVKQARDRQVRIMGDVDLFRETYPKAKIIGITGTNGKSTTTTLIGHILTECGVPVAVGGNVGVPALSLSPLPNDGVYVLELSSYQLDLSACLSLDYAVWMNITPDHLERHGSMEDYVYAKMKIFAGKGNPPQSMISIDDAYSLQVYDEMNEAHPGFLTPVSVNRPLLGGIFVLDDLLVDATGDERLVVGDLSGLDRLKGRHNYQNIAMAYGICRAYGLAPDAIMRGVETFPGLAHRQEVVRILGNVTFINDSKATNADATSHALSAFDTIYWIVGGVAKSDGIDELLPLLNRVKKAYLIGESATNFAKVLEGRVDYVSCGDMDTAITRAYADASLLGGTVLLSPACASFDQYRDFEHRGDVFRDCVQQLVVE